MRYAILIITLLSVSPIHATVVKKMPLQWMLKSSAAVALVGTTLIDDKVGKKEAATLVQFKVLEVFFGAVESDSLSFTMPVGFVPNSEVYKVIKGLPSFELGQRYLVFLRHGDWQDTPITNWWNGAFKQILIKKRPYFVDSEGRALQGFDKNGAKLGKKIHGKVVRYKPLPAKVNDKLIKKTAANDGGIQVESAFRLETETTNIQSNQVNTASLKEAGSIYMEMRRLFKGMSHLHKSSSINSKSKNMN